MTKFQIIYSEMQHKQLEGSLSHARHISTRRSNTVQYTV